MHSPLLVTLMLLAATATAMADVRSPRVPVALRGNWTPATETCPGQSSSTFVFAEQSFDGGGSSCHVDWVEERGATPGVIYSLHMRCPGNADGAMVNTIVWLKSENETAIGPSFEKLVAYRRCQ